MNTLKTLESIGQTTSIKQYDSVQELLESMKIDEKLISIVQKNSLELVCGILPEDDKDEEE